jgi:hypothetical protein
LRYTEFAFWPGHSNEQTKSAVILVCMSFQPSDLPQSYLFSPKNARLHIPTAPGHKNPAHPSWQSAHPEPVFVQLANLFFIWTKLFFNFYFNIIFIFSVHSLYVFVDNNYCYPLFCP